MASRWQRPPDTGCDEDGIPHGFRKVMGDMAAEMGDDELMRASQGSIHDPRHTSKSFKDIHQKFFGAAKKRGNGASCVGWMRTGTAWTIPVGSTREARN